jgi:hypothetical protein
MARKSIFTFNVRGAGQAASELARIRKNLEAAEKRLMTEPGASTRKVGRALVYYARRLAPVDTGALVNAINLRLEGRGKAYKCVVESRTPDNPRSRFKKDYHIKMHEDEAFAAKIRTGDPKYMYKTMSRLSTLAEEEKKRIKALLVSDLNNKTKVN